MVQEVISTFALGWKSREAQQCAAAGRMLPFVLAVTAFRSSSALPVRGVHSGSASSRAAPCTAIRMAAEVEALYDEAFCFGLPGAIPPAGQFDPAKLLDGRSKAEVYRWRESEITHGRVSMLASAGFLTQEGFHPLAENLPVLEQVRHLPDPLLFSIPTIIGFCETARSQRWTRNEVIRNVVPKTEGEYLGYRPGDVGYYPGDIGFDPLGIKPDDPAELRTMQEKELAHCRMAMLAAAGFMAQEAVTGTTWGSLLRTTG